MRTNPNIILSGNQMAAPQLPDVNAMMQTRTAGMENIYAIEQQRAAQAQAAQKEQAAALVDALAPAYATAFKGGGTKESITAAYNLLPPEIQPGVKGQIDKLMAMPSDDLRLSALEASLAGSDAGRTLLDRIPTEIQRINAEIQRGQLEVSRANAAQDAATAGVPKPMSAAEQARIDLDERKFAAEQEKAAREAAMPEGMDAKTKVKFEQAYPKSASALRTSVSNMDNDLAALEQLIEDPGLKSISGTLGARTVNLSADAKRAQSLFDRVKAGAGLAALVELKQSSPAGGALGNVSNQEGNTLRESRGEFLQDQEYNDLRNALIRYYNVLERSKANIIAAFDDTYSYRGENASADILQAAQEQFRDIETKTKEKFGEPPATGAFRIRNVRQQ
jgi:hypothetical protein